MNAIKLDINSADDIVGMSIDEAVEYMRPVLLEKNNGSYQYLYEAETDKLHWLFGAKPSFAGDATSQWPSQRVVAVLYKGQVYVESIQVREFNERHNIKH